MGRQETGGESIPAERRLARAQEHDIVRHHREQAGKIASVYGIDKAGMYLMYGAFIWFHWLSPFYCVARKNVRDYC
ncbi:hypothetical protein GCM10027296_04830 [Chitinimonas naiadis]